MASNKVFTDDINPDQELKIYRNKDNRCYIMVENTEDTIGFYSSFITLDSEDIAELILELQKIKSEIDNG